MGDSQKLGYLLLDVGGKRELSRGDVAISAAAELTWLGFTEEHMVVAMDSTGLLTGLTQVAILSVAIGLCSESC